MSCWRCSKLPHKNLRSKLYRLVRRLAAISGRFSAARDSRSRSRSQASACQLHEAYRGGSSGKGAISPLRSSIRSSMRISARGRSGMVTNSGCRCRASSPGFAGAGFTGSVGVINRAEESKSAYAKPDVRLVSVAGADSASASPTARLEREAIDFAMYSSTSLCRQVCPQRCFAPWRSLYREFHPLTRSSPACS